MKIGYFRPSFLDDPGDTDAIGRHPIALARAVVEASRGACTVDLVAYGARRERRAVSPGVALRLLPTPRRPANPADAVSWEAAGAVADYDLIHAFGIFNQSTEVVTLCARQRGKPLALTDDGAWWSELGHQSEMLALADRLICPSDFAASVLPTRRPRVVVRGGVDAVFYCPPETPRQRAYALFVGRLLPRKGLDALIRALPDDLPLKVCGRPERPDHIERLRDLARGKDVAFVGDADDEAVRALHRDAWATVLPAVHRDADGAEHLIPALTGFALLEAMACGTPAIATRVGSLPELVRHGETGFVVDDAGQAVAAIRHLAERPDEADRLGRNGRAAAAGEFSRARVGEALLAIYAAMRRESRAEAA